MKKSNQEVINDLINHLKLGKPILNKRRVPIGKVTEDHYRTWLGHLDKWLNKSFLDLCDLDIDEFRKRLKNDEIRRNDGKTYKSSVKKDVEQKFLKTLLCYVNKPELALFVVGYAEDVEIPALSKEEVEKIINESRLRDKIIFQVLFDGGFRASEFLNIKFKDIKDDNLKSDGYYKIRITKSKTKPRTVGLTLPLSTELLKLWIDSNRDKIGTSKPLVDLSYRHFNLTIRRLGSRVLKQKITPHQLRHSSATYFCHYLNQYQLCKRYGWAMASDMPQRYIDREGVDDDQINQKVVGEETAEFRKQVSALQEQLNIQHEGEKNKDNVIDGLKQQMDELRLMVLQTAKKEIKSKELDLETLKEKHKPIEIETAH